MADDISAMLFEAKLPLSLWGEALTTQIHVWNCLPTSSLKGMTPHEAWFKHKPDVSHLCSWGCLAYVFIQKDKRCSLQSHMETCVFVGYPSGYKGWKFYNPTTRKYLIIDHKLTYQGNLASKDLLLTYSDAFHGDCINTG